MIRHLLRTLCPNRHTGHAMRSGDGRCTECGVFVPAEPAYTIEQLERLRDLRAAYRLGRRTG